MFCNPFALPIISPALLCNWVMSKVRFHLSDGGNNRVRRHTSGKHVLKGGRDDAHAIALLMISKPGRPRISSARRRQKMTVLRSRFRRVAM